MGGLGSGRRWRHNVKGLTADLPALDIRQLHRTGLLYHKSEKRISWHQGERLSCSILIRLVSDGLQLRYSQRNPNGGEEEHNYTAPITWTACNFGGHRPWFVCPVEACSKRVAILYGGTIFACRECLELSYSCQREAIDLRLIRRANKIGARINCFPGQANRKPSNMHWATYIRLQDEYSLRLSAAFEALRENLDLDNI